MGNNRSISFDSGAFRTEYIRSSIADHDGHRKRGSTPPTGKRKKFPSFDTLTPEEYGWFEDFESPYNTLTSDFGTRPLQRALTLPSPASEPPMYILESSLETQQLWYATAGRRPQQPSQEREYFEKLWSQNFEVSSINLEESNNKAQRSSTSISTRRIKDPPYEVLFRGKSPFSNSVSRSFSDNNIPPSMTLQVPFYRIVRNDVGSVFAEFLIVVSLGSQSGVTLGIWKRHSDFSDLAKHIVELNLRSPASTPNSHFKNTLLSWQCVLQRKRWFKCLDNEYLALKCFLIERFMHDLLFEAFSPTLINDFLGLI